MDHTRVHITAYLSTGDVISLPSKSVLREDGILSYPTVDLRKSGFIYVGYDQGRPNVGQQTIFLSKITEADILEGRLVSQSSSLNEVVSWPGYHGDGRRASGPI